MTIEEGKAAPLFTLQDKDGNKVSLKDLRGQNVVVYFYPRDDTPGCTKEACGFRDLSNKIQKHNAVVVGVEGGARDLVVRSPRKADRFRPLGAPARRWPQ